MDELPSYLVLKTDYKIWELYPNKMDLSDQYSKNDFVGLNVAVLSEDQPLVLPYLDQREAQGVDFIKVKNYLQNKVAGEVSRDPEAVTIKKDETGNVVFEGHGLYGRKLDLDQAARMMQYALKHNISYLHIPLIKTMPEVNIEDQSLKDLGITELVSSGETNFANSPNNRIHNIKLGLNKFNGHIIKPAEEFVFGNVLGPVEGYTGFLPELVIKGDRTLPEFGGGLCQVSTTAYRSVLAAGFPVTMRRNHSYAVSYYTPYGLDATVYPPSVDFKFINDGPSHLLMQTFTIGAKAYYNLYGTKDNRDVTMIGPYYSGWISPPATRKEFSNKLTPGEVQVVGHAVPGLNSVWYRHVIYKNAVDENGAPKSFLERIFSKYQARPNFFIVGQAAPVQNEAVTDTY